MFLKNEKIKKEWTDYNGHMNVAYYIYIFDKAADILLTKFNMAGDSALKNKKSTFVVETHTTYNRELKLDDEAEVYLTHFDHDNKRIHYKVSMFSKSRKYLASTTEVLSLYIDLNKRKVINFDLSRVEIMKKFIKNNSSTFQSKNLFFTNKLKK
jgi:acyl-CoA thioester hydrolase